jgi:hypothetical protein
VRKDVLKSICQLKGIHVPKTVLHMRINDQLSQPEDLSAKVEGISESRLLAFLRGKGPVRWSTTA